MKIDNRNNLGLLLKDLCLTGCGIEVGAGEGKFSRVIIENFGLSKIYLLDAWTEFTKEEYDDSSNCSQAIEDARYKKVIDATKKYGEKVVVIKGDSREVFRNFADNYFDFVYIDANHEYKYVKNDITNWYPKVKSGGVFSGHDYLDGINRFGNYGVKSAVNEFCKTIDAVPEITGEVGRRHNKSWYFIKK